MIYMRGDRLSLQSDNDYKLNVPSRMYQWFVAAADDRQTMIKDRYQLLWTFLNILFMDMHAPQRRSLFIPFVDTRAGDQSNDRSLW